MFSTGSATHETKRKKVNENLSHLAAGGLFLLTHTEESVESHTGNATGINLNPFGCLPPPGIIISIETFSPDGTATVRVTTRYKNETTIRVEKQYTVPGTYYLDDTNHFNFFFHKGRIWKLEFRTRIDFPSSQIEARRRFWGV